MLSDFLLSGFGVRVGFSPLAQPFGSSWVGGGWEYSLKWLSGWAEALVFIPGAP